LICYRAWLPIEWWDGGLFGDGFLFGLYVVPFRISFLRTRVPTGRVTTQGWLAAGLTRDFVWVFLRRRGAFRQVFVSVFLPGKAALARWYFGRCRCVRVAVSPLWFASSITCYSFLFSCFCVASSSLVGRR
jgi:hypothetical protein